MALKAKTPSELIKKDTSSPPPPEGFIPPPEGDTFAEDFIEPPPPHEEKIPEQVVRTLADILTYAILIIHRKAAEATGYQGWLVTDEEREMWSLIMKEVVPYLPVKHAVLIITLIALSISEGSKVAGYMRYERERQQAEKANTLSER